MKPNKFRSGELADAFGINRQVLMSLIKSMGITANNPSSSIEKKQVERVIRKLTRDNLIEVDIEYLAWIESGHFELFFRLSQIDKKFGVDARQEVSDFHRGHLEELQLSKLTNDATVKNRILLAITESALINQGELEKVVSSVIVESDSGSYDSVMTVI